MDNAFNSQSGQLAAEIANQRAMVTDQIGGATGESSVPEPSAIGLPAIGVAGLLGRRNWRWRG